MVEHIECKRYEICGWRKELGGCPLGCIHYKHKDEVFVVRCKDCKWAEYGKDYEPYCNHWKSGLYAAIKDNDFCSYGERKEQ